ncbi:hypothetical protein DSCO28_50290 [Desulfosarcina ovata subsp. sediminis]|uniref:Right handed beta helix domain-containing protein n=1 Tax=Desulfosarcina ovata subsp. sediminis TaxID=885957 RepID=A0A5K7ZW29_9BACT|nr:right-handed parallel beta-helix repeat-containing protein [Desulfosarcina ovata]BBO84463.1 hypothetical protein DSCO28_50290 [Desulfosarcina ovata subsp. sediminis]
MNKKIKILLIIMLFFCESTWATDYYIDTTGGAASLSACADSDPGSGNRCTLAQFNTGATAGDTAQLFAGTYTTALTPTNSGTSGNYITYQIESSQAEWAVIVSPSSAGSTLNSIDYIKFDGLYFSGTSGRWIDADYADYVIVQGCKFYNAANYSGIRLVSCMYWRINNSTFSDAPLRDTGACTYWDAECTTAWNAQTTLPNDCDCETAPADMIQVNTGSVGIVVDGCTFGNSSHQSVSSVDGEDTIIRNCTTDNAYRSGFGSLQGGSGSGRSLIENNTIENIGDLYTVNPSKNDRWYMDRGSAGHPGMQLQSQDTIVRLNTIRSSSQSMAIGSNNSYEQDRAADHTRIYHNTMHDNLRDLRVYVADVVLSALIMINNISSSSGTGNSGTTDVYGHVAYWSEEGYANLNYLINNAFCPGTGDLYWHGYTTEYSIASLESTYPSECSDNISVSSPAFTDADNGYFSLTSSSTGLIDAGAFLTTITSSTGSGTSVTVDDPLYFYDGWSIPGETADTIYTSAGQSAVITGVDYSTGVITLATSITWTNGDGVTVIDYTGSAPDIGVDEYDLTSYGIAPKFNRGASVVTIQ